MESSQQKPTVDTEKPGSMSNGQSGLNLEQINLEKLKQTEQTIKLEITKTEEEIENLKKIQETKESHLHGLKRKLGITVPEKQRNANSLVGPLLTDRYQITMSYVYWLKKRHKDQAVFDLFFRKNPFEGEYTIFCGLEECLKYVENFKFTKSDIEYLKKTMSKELDQDFYKYLLELDTSEVEVYAMREGSVCFPNTPILRVEGPLGVVQLLETTLLNLINFPSLVATNAARHRHAAHSSNRALPVRLLEFGLRRAQGPDGGLSASRYSYLGGFDGTSNLMAGKMFGIPTYGTYAHSIIQAYQNIDVDKSNHEFLFNMRTQDTEDFTSICLNIENEFRNSDLDIFKSSNREGSNHKSELLAFIACASSLPTNFLALVDTYDVIKSGLINFTIVALGLIRFGYKPKGIRIDSGDLAYLSREAQQLFEKIALKYKLPEFMDLDIVASNDINEDTIYSLNDQHHRITCFGIGTHLVTCHDQPALGCVYKLDHINGQPCMKLTSGSSKLSIPFKKNVYRLYNQDGFTMLDLIQTSDEAPPEPRRRIFCRHPFIAEKRTYANPTRVEDLLQLWFKNGRIIQTLPSLEECRAYAERSLKLLRPDIKRHLNPTPYKVSLSEELYEKFGKLRLDLAPPGELV